MSQIFLFQDKVKMIVYPFQLAIIGHQSKIVQQMLEFSRQDQKRTKDGWEMIEKKTKINFRWEWSDMRQKRLIIVMDKSIWLIKGTIDIDVKAYSREVQILLKSYISSAELSCQAEPEPER